MTQDNSLREEISDRLWVNFDNAPKHIDGLVRECTDELMEIFQTQLDKATEEARKETVLHFRKIAQYEKDKGYGCDRILGETDIMAKNRWEPLKHLKESGEA